MPAKLIFAEKNIHVTKKEIGKQYKIKKKMLGDHNFRREA